MAEAEKLIGELSESNFPDAGVPFTPEELSRRLGRYEALTETLRAIVATGCYWDDGPHTGLWVRCLERIANNANVPDGLLVWLELRRYPVLSLLYAGGIAATWARRYGTLGALLTGPAVRQRNTGETEPLVLSVNPATVSYRDSFKQLPNMKLRHTPVSDRLFEVLRPSLLELIPDDVDYQKSFDRFEYLLALVHADLYERLGNDAVGPMGCFAWRDRARGRLPSPIAIEVEKELSGQDSSWGPLREGLFGGSLERLGRIKQAVDEEIHRRNW